VLCGYVCVRVSESCLKSIGGYSDQRYILLPYTMKFNLLRYMTAEKIFVDFKVQI